MNVRSNAVPGFIVLLCSFNTWGRYLPKDDARVHTALHAHSDGKAHRVRLRPRNAVNDWADEKQTKLQKLIQQIYQAEDSVKKETLEVKRLRVVVAAADRELEEASNRVRTLSADLQEAQRVAAQSALKSHSAHLQLSAHDQLMFTSRQRVDALSAQAVAAQAEIGMWPGLGMFYNRSLPVDLDERQEQMLGQAYPQEMSVGYGKAPIIFRNALPQPQFYPVMSNGVQFVPVEAG